MIKFPQYLGRVSTMYKNRRDKLNYEDVKFFNEISKPEKDSKAAKNTDAKQSAKKVTPEQVCVEKKPRGRPKKAK